MLPPNSSEWNAWLYGRAFKNYVNNLQSTFPTLTVAAHSQGNVVVGSATQEGLTLENYVMLQAAIPTGCYNTSLTFNEYAKFVQAETQTATPDLASSLGYRGFVASAYGNVGHYFSFYNPQDFALATGTYFGGALSTNWEANEVSYKPDGPPANSGKGFYSMNNATPTFNRVWFTVPTVPIRSRAVTEAHESMSFVARPRSQAIGADINDPLVFGSATNLQATYGFGRALTDHSGEFLRDYDSIYQLYNTFEGIIAPPQ
jgi:hypothetical protein